MTGVSGSPPDFHFGSECAHADVRFRFAGAFRLAEINLRRGSTDLLQIFIWRVVHIFSIVLLKGGG